MKTRFFLIVCAFIMGLACACRAWADWNLYAGEKQASAGNYVKAVQLMEMSGKWESRNPRLHYRLGLAYYRQALRKKDLNDLDRAAQSFERLKPYLPGRAWLYLALIDTTKLKAKQPVAGGWETVRRSVDKALENEPGSALIAYQAGRILLSEPGKPDPVRKEKALMLLKRSIELHAEPLDSRFLPKASLYLKPVLKLVWKKFRSSGALAYVTPADRASYKELLAFMDARKLWPNRDRVYRTYLQFEESDYKEFCLQGLAYLQRKQYQNAKLAFTKAFWTRNWNFQEAKAGILISDAALGKLTKGPHEVLQEETGNILIRVLEEEEPGMVPYRPYLERAVEIAGDDYAKGLFAFYQGRYQEAEAYLTKAPKSAMLKRRFLAMTLLKLGESRRAGELLKSIVTESDPDIREVFLMKDLNLFPPIVIQGKIGNITGRKFEGWQWYAEKGKTSLTVNLMPGTSRFEFEIPGPLEGEIYALFYLDGKPLPGVWRFAGAGSKAAFEVKTEGGLHWLQSEVLNLPDYSLKPETVIRSEEVAA